MIALGIQAEALKKRLLPFPEVLREFQRFQSELAALTEDVRGAAHRLHPSTVEHIGLTPALKAHCAEISLRTGIQVRYSGQEVRKLPPTLALSLYRVVQEALRNVVKHSHARKALVRLRKTPGAIRLTISDDGLGLIQQAKRSRGIGISLMEERAREAGGTFELFTVKGRGVRIDIRIPLPLRLLAREDEAQ